MPCRAIRFLPNSPEPEQSYIQRIDEDHAHSHQSWLEMGSQQYLGAMEVEQLQANADLPSHSVAAITLAFESSERKTK
jgi:hypothetical protein